MDARPAYEAAATTVIHPWIVDTLWFVAGVNVGLVFWALLWMAKHSKQA